MDKKLRERVSRVKKETSGAWAPASATGKTKGSGSRGKVEKKGKSEKEGSYCPDGAARGTVPLYFCVDSTNPEQETLRPGW